MNTTITFNVLSDDETHQIIPANVEHHHLLRPPSLIEPQTFKSLPSSILQSIEANRQQRLHNSHSISDVPAVQQSSIDTTDDDLDGNDETTTTTTSSSQKSRPRSSRVVARTQRSPSDVRVSLCPERRSKRNLDVHQHLANSQIEVSKPQIETDLRGSDPSLLERVTPSKQNRMDYLRKTVFGRRIHSSFSSSTTLRSLNRRRSTQNISSRHPYHQSSRSRRHNLYHLPRNSKWHFVRHHLHDIAMMNESYARMKLAEADRRWIQLREQIRAQVLDMREMSILRQQVDGVLKKSHKTSFDLKAIPVNEVVHVERDGRVYSIGTRDLVLGRLLGDEEIQLDTFAQLDARRQFQVQQSLLKQQKGRTRLKKHIAFSFCLCNLSFIVLMFAAMFIFAMKTLIELKSREFI